MDTRELQVKALLSGLAVGLVCDPKGLPGEEWVCTVGLDVVTAGSTPESAVQKAMQELATVREQAPARA